jgi:hypothetical protein
MRSNELPRSRAARYPFPKQIISLAKQSFEEFDPKRLKYLSVLCAWLGLIEAAG